MRFFVIIAGVIHAFRPEVERQMQLNETVPIKHPLIDQLDCRDASRKAARRPQSKPQSITAIYIGGRYFERRHA